MDQHDQKQKITVSESVKELKPDDLDKISGGGQPVQLPRNDERFEESKPAHSR